ncbi:polysaccharide deacetylase family protein [Rubrobacter taiwanensis]|jgi:peptidoglycan/xylan/chitin deacetylase (PgdA/CDA1 family)|nr:polysaccharide deacetylase family protein [Rubrobacter taiwanensis]
MSDASGAAAGWDSQRPHAAVSVTFDNLGEAADLERGLWPGGEPLGRHFSVRRVLPRVLDLLDESGIRATFFVEGLNARIYPEALLEIASRGHELGYHGWRHEYWAGLSPAEEVQLLERGVREMERLNLRLRGFRPPGGRLNPSSWGLLAELGFTYCSPAGEGAGMLEGLAVLPFDWRLIDAYYYLPRFGELRRADTGSEDPLPPHRFGERVRAVLEKIVGEGGYASLLFHPFLADREERFRVLNEALGVLRDLVRSGRVWCAPCGEAATRLHERRAAFAGGLRLDLTQT